LVAVAETHNERSNANASLTITTCSAEQWLTCDQEHVRIKLAFHNSCFTARTPSVGDKPFIGPESINSFGFGVDDDGHFTANGVTISWTGASTGIASDTGRGTWTATGLPASCGGNDSASGTYKFAWVEDGSKMTGTFALAGFPSR
jgi:hypothetical protein